MKRLSDQQILSTLILGEVFPETIYFTEAKGMDSITIHAKENATIDDVQRAVKTIFPKATVVQFKTCDSAYYIWSEAECIGSLHMTQKEKPSAPTESQEETTFLHDTTEMSISEMVEREA